MTINAFDNCHFPKIHGGLQQDKGVLGHVGSMSSHVFPWSMFVEHVWSAQFLKIISGKSVPKVDSIEMNVAYQLDLVAMNVRRSRIHRTKKIIEYDNRFSRSSLPWGTNMT